MKPDIVERLRYDKRLADERSRNDLRDAADEIERLRAWVSDCQSGMYINCVYCGHRYGPREDTPVAMADVLREHCEQCPDHPLSAAKAEIEKLHMEIGELQQRLRGHIAETRQLAELVADMRHSQCEYFRSRSRSTLNHAKLLEDRVDKALRDAIVGDKQGKLFG